MITQMLKSLFKTNKKQKSTKAQKDEKLVLQKTKSNEIKNNGRKGRPTWAYIKRNNKPIKYSFVASLITLIDV